ncbi:hypothetical protein ACAG39_02575 [Caldicellulosiruptoraceae bacterium PP1]
MSRKNGKNNKYTTWVITLFIISFLISAALNYISAIVTNKLSIFVSFVSLIIVIIIGILFDIIGIAVTAANEIPFHSMASKKVKGAKNSIWLIKNASKVSSICNDVIGDVCGILSGSISAGIVFFISKNNNINIVLFSILLTASVAAVTISGKSIGKYFAISKSHEIVKIVGSIISIFIK